MHALRPKGKFASGLWDPLLGNEKRSYIMQKTMRKEKKPSGVKSLFLFLLPRPLSWHSYLYYLCTIPLRKKQFMIEQTEKVLVQAACSFLSWVNNNQKLKDYLRPLGHY